MSRAPFVMVRDKAGITHVEGGADRAFRNALLAFAPRGEPYKHLRDGLLNGPKGDGGRHALEYFGPERLLKEIAPRLHPLVDEIELVLASRFGVFGFKEWLNLTDFGNDYRIIKGFIAWAAMAEHGDA